jgi:hypothetical protein
MALLFNNYVDLLNKKNCSKKKAALTIGQAAFIFRKSKRTLVINYEKTKV